MARTTSTATELNWRRASRHGDAGNASATNAKVESSHKEAQKAQRNHRRLVKALLCAFCAFLWLIKATVSPDLHSQMWLVFDRPLIYSQVYDSPVKFIVSHAKGVKLCCA